MPTVDLQTVSLFYEEQGAGEPLLLLHGLGSNGRSWEYQQEAFARKFRVVVPDVRGHGQSAKPPGPYSVAQFSKDIFTLLDHLQIDQFHLMGLSMGGMIGFQMAVEQPERFKSMIVVNSGPELIPRGLKEKWQIWQRKLITRFVAMDKIAELIGGRLFPEPHQANLKEQFIQQMGSNDPKAYKAATDALLGWSVSARLDRINFPILVVSGDMDYTPVAFKEAYMRQLPTSQLHVVENSRHATPVDQPEAFNTAVLNFLHTVN